MRQRGHFTPADQPRLDTLLDLVALGTVADLVRLDRNNRILVDAGIERMRRGAAQRASRPCFAWPGAMRATPGPPTWVLPWARASMPPAGSPT